MVTKTFKEFLIYEQDDDRELRREREPQTRTQTKTRTKHPLDDILDDLLGVKHDIVPTSDREQEQGTRDVSRGETERDLAVATDDELADRLSRTRIPDEGADLLDRLLAAADEIDDEISDEEAAQRSRFARRTRGPGQARQQARTPSTTPGYTEPETTTLPVKRETLPAVPEKLPAGKGYVTPKWYKVSDLPGYLIRAIRGLVRRVFKNYTDTPLEDILILANLEGQDVPNTRRELNAVAGYLMKNATPVKGHWDFSNFLPGYEAEVALFKGVDGRTYLVAKDIGGHYIYTWPSKYDKF